MTAAGLVEALTELAELHRDGILDTEAFERSKARLLDPHRPVHTDADDPPAGGQAAGERPRARRRGGRAVALVVVGALGLAGASVLLLEDGDTDVRLGQPTEEPVEQASAGAPNQGPTEAPATVFTEPGPVAAGPAAPTAPPTTPAPTSPDREPVAAGTLEAPSTAPRTLRPSAPGVPEPPGSDPATASPTDDEQDLDPPPHAPRPSSAAPAVAGEEQGGQDDSPSLTAGEQVPGCPFQPGGQIIPDWSDLPAFEQAVLSPVVRFSTGLNIDDYDCAYGALSDHYRRSFAPDFWAWVEQQATSDVIAYEIVALDVAGSTAHLRARWTSTQAPSHSPAGSGETCTIWSLDYTLVRDSAGVWTIDDALGQWAPRAPC